MSYPNFEKLEKSSIAPPELLVKLKFFSLLPEWIGQQLPFVCPDCLKRISSYGDDDGEVECLICNVNKLYDKDDNYFCDKDRILLDADQISGELVFLEDPLSIEKVFDDWIRMH